MIGNRLLNDGHHLLDCKRVDGIHFVDEGLEVFHFCGTFKDNGQLVARDPTIIK